MITETLVLQIVVGALVFAGVLALLCGLFIWILDDLLRWITRR